MKKIAFLFLIYNDINFENIWNHFFLNVDKNKYNIYIHQKFPHKLSFFNHYIIDNYVPTSYQSHITITLAFNALLQEALKDPNNSHFILLSGSCIPVKSFNYIYHFLNPNFSYFNICPHQQCFPRANEALQFIHKDFIQKASTWCILNKKHANVLISEPFYIKWFYNCYGADEHAYISSLFYHNLQNELITTPNLAINATTFTNWEGMDYPFPSTNGLKNYDSITHEELSNILRSKGTLFARKFNKSCNFNDIYLDFIKS
jgi:hypothetical protein